MTVYFSQIYIEVGVNFPFTHHLLKYLSREITSLIEPSVKYCEAYGQDYNLILRISAKKKLQHNELRGPTVFKKSKDVEYSIFLPFDVIVHEADVIVSALKYLFKGICEVLIGLSIDPSKVLQREKSIIEYVCSDPTMISTSDNLSSPKL